MKGKGNCEGDTEMVELQEGKLAKRKNCRSIPGNV
jgi:hypothetical protein